jgi:protein-S-isoprenylcysteine O-methyltransferase Ste14
MLDVPAPWPPYLVWASRLAGGALVLIALALFRLARTQLGDDFVALLEPASGSHLRVDGIYGRVRHPVYLAIMLAAVGWPLMWTSWTGLVLAVACLVFFPLKARAEEQRLRRRFPEYQTYTRRVPGLVPRLRSRHVR